MKKRFVLMLLFFTILAILFFVFIAIKENSKRYNGQNYNILKNFNFVK